MDELIQSIIVANKALQPTNCEFITLHLIDTERMQLIASDICIADLPALTDGSKIIEVDNTSDVSIREQIVAQV